jgi:hypothetical protein
MRSAPPCCVIPFADNFLAGAIISLVLPAGLLVAVVLWYHLTVRRFPAPPRSTPRGATPDNPSGPNPTTGGHKPVGEATGSTGAGT